jgi:cytochrome c-type biogenesis protein
MEPRVSLSIAFGGGVVSFFSPCILPLLPAYVCYISGESLKAVREKPPSGRLVLFLRATLFILGFSFVFIALGASASLVGKFFLAYQKIFQRIGGVLIIILGLHLSGVLPFKLLLRHRLGAIDSRVTGNLGALLVGATCAFAWIPCVGSILASILILAGASGSVKQGVLLLGVYSSGLALPFLIAAGFLNYFLELIKKFNRAAKVLTVIAGIGLVIMGGLIYFGIFNFGGNI